MTPALADGSTARRSAAAPATAAADADVPEIEAYPPPEDVTDSPLREKFVRQWDAVGDWADWYNQQRLVDRFGEWFEVTDYQPITRGGEFVGAVLQKKG